MKSQRVIKRSPDSTIEVQEPDGVKRVYSGTLANVPNLTDANFKHIHWHFHPDGSRLAITDHNDLTYYLPPTAQPPYRIHIQFPHGDMHIFDDVSVDKEPNDWRNFVTFMDFEHREKVTSDSAYLDIIARNISKFGFEIDRNTRALTKRPPDDERFMEEATLLGNELKGWGGEGYVGNLNGLSTELKLAAIKLKEIHTAFTDPAKAEQIKRINQLMLDHGVDLNAHSGRVQESSGLVQTSMDELSASMKQIKEITDPILSLKQQAGFVGDIQRRRGDQDKGNRR